MSRALALAVVLAGAACASQVEVHSIQSPAAHFERYRTVKFEEVTAAPRQFFSSPRSQDVRDHVREFAGGVLPRRGYVVGGEGRADLVLRVEAGRRERKVAASLGTTPLGGGPGNVPPLAGAETVPGPTSVEMAYHGQLDEEERDLVDGAFVIDAFDGETGELVWHGSARAVVSPGEVDYERLRRSVDSVLATFPARASGAPGG